jgi:hypothetical protein
MNGVFSYGTLPLQKVRNGTIGLDRRFADVRTKWTTPTSKSYDERNVSKVRSHVSPASRLLGLRTSRHVTSQRSYQRHRCRNSRRAPSRYHAAGPLGVNGKAGEFSLAAKERL